MKFQVNNKLMILISGEILELPSSSSKKLLYSGALLANNNLSY